MFECAYMISASWIRVLSIKRAMGAEGFVYELFCRHIDALSVWTRLPALKTWTFRFSNLTHSFLDTHCNRNSFLYQQYPRLWYSNLFIRVRLLLSIMGLYLGKLLSSVWWGKKTYKILMLGLDSAGMSRASLISLASASNPSDFFVSASRFLEASY